MSPFEILGVEPDATPETLKNRWRELAQRLHPDKGGDASEFDRVRKAYHAALKIAAAPKKCLVCRGTGRVTRALGFNSLMVRCDGCGGTGTAGGAGEI